MIFQEKTLKRYHWKNMSAFRKDVEEYLKSINLKHEPERRPGRHQYRNLSMSENSGYFYISIRQMFRLPCAECSA
jgi:hypothetical protein